MNKPHRYFFGYGSLLFLNGYRGRWMERLPDKLKHFVTLKGYKRGFYQHFGGSRHFGIIKNEGWSVLGAIAPIWTKDSYLSLLASEGVLSRRPAYVLTRIGEWDGRPLCTLVNEPDNSTMFKQSKVNPSYVCYCWKGAHPKYRREFVKEVKQELIDAGIPIDSYT